MLSKWVSNAPKYSEEIPVPKFSGFAEYHASYCGIAKALAKAAPELRQGFYIKGTAPIALTHTKHRLSWDIDLCTRGTLEPVDGMLKKLKRAFKGSDLRGDSNIVQGVLAVPGFPAINLDMFTSLEAVLPSSTEQHQSMGGLSAESLPVYVENKVDTLCGRVRHSKDCFDLASLYSDPKLSVSVRARMNRQLSATDLGRISEACFLLNVSEFNANIEGFRSIGQDEMVEFAEFAQSMRGKKQMVERRRREAIDMERFDRQFGIG